LTIALSAAIPVAVLFSDFNAALAKIAVAVLGAGVSVASGIISLGKYRETWVKYRQAAELLTVQKFAFDTRIEPYHDPETRLTLFYRVCEDIMAHERNDWAGAQGAQPQGPSEETSS
jgi:hypothetical protein